LGKVNDDEEDKDKDHQGSDDDDDEQTGFEFHIGAITKKIHRHSISSKAFAPIDIEQETRQLIQTHTYI
jgi:hypothetical protein